MRYNLQWFGGRGASSGSSYPTKVFHSTNQTNAEAILKNGFKVGDGNTFGNEWGNGVYLSSDKLTADFWHDETDTDLFTKGSNQQAVKLEVTVPNGLNIKKVDITNDSIENLADKFDNRDKSRYNTLSRSMKPTQAYSKLMQEKGFDGLNIVANKNGRMNYEAGGNQLVIFNPKNLKVKRVR